MGNTPSVEAPRKGSRATQKLSKPRTGNPATAGLLNPSSVADIIRRPPSTTGRRASLPCNSTPVPSPRHPESDNTAVDDSLVASHAVPVLVEGFPSHPLLQSGPQGALHLEGQSIRGRRMSRRNSAYTGVDEVYEQAQLSLATSLPRNLSQSSMNYDLSPYEAKGFLNLIEGLPFEDQLTVSEGPLQVALSRRQSYTPSYHPSHSDATALLPRTNSDASLYTPMRRRSLMTPGVATRPAPVDLDVPPNIPTRNDQPQTSPSDPPEPMGPSFLSIPNPAIDPNLVPRAHTPCETDYKQTGAFKHGTLRITNGSPARTPAREASEDGLLIEGSPTRTSQRGYFDAGSRVQDNHNVDSAGNEFSGPPHIATALSVVSANDPITTADDHQAAIEFLPELTLTMSPLLINEVKQDPPELQTTSKNTAIEDQLFEEALPEFGTEVLNLRLDYDTKPHSSSPIAPLEGEIKKEINRSGSGIVSSPTSSAPPKSLSKADSGYSSSVSIRSLSSKRNGQQQFEHLHNLEATASKVLAPQSANLLGDSPTWTRSATVSASEPQSQTSVPDSPPPPVPEKDNIRKTRSGSLPINSRSPSEMSDPSPDKISTDEVSIPTLHSTLRQKSSFMPTSTLTISSARKPGKLHRLLSGARAPLAVHVTHAEDRDVSVPPVPQAVHEKLHERATFPPDFENSPEDIDAWEGNSKLATTSNISQTHHDESTVRAPEDNGSGVPTGRDRVRSFKTSLRFHSLGSTITRAASSVIKNPILRKPTLARMNANSRDETCAESSPTTTVEHSDETSQWRSRGTERAQSFSPVGIDGISQYRGQDVVYGRSNSLPGPSDDLNFRAHEDIRRSSLASQNEYHANAFLKPSFPKHYTSSRTPPPISMKTRNIGPLRVPPPIRPRSTPPVRPGPATLSHKSSREGIHSYPPYHYPMSSNHAGFSGGPGQENLYAYSAAQIQAFLNQHSQVPDINAIRPSSVQPSMGGYWAPGANISSAAPSREPSFDHSRRNSLTSQTSQRSNLSTGQSWSHYAPYETPTLRHRSSYDSFSFQTRPIYGQDNGPYPSLSHGNGQAYANHFLGNQAVAHQSRQYQQHARHLPRGHLRHHSLDQYGSPVPYRVLHSYNSPAYRGVPIWSS